MRMKAGLWAKGGVRDARAILDVKSTGFRARLTPDLSKVSGVDYKQILFGAQEWGRGRRLTWKIHKVARS